MPRLEEIIETEQDAASERFNDVASKWDQQPSTVSATDAMSVTIKEMKWYSCIKKEKGNRIRAMDFGCGTGLLTYKILDPDVFHEIVGVDVAEGMINTFERKIKASKLNRDDDIKMSAICKDLSKIDLERINSIVGSKLDPKEDKDNKGFDLVYTLLAFHHIETPEKLLNEILKGKYLNPGGRIVVMDYENDKTKQIFHPVHLKVGQHYEHDGFSEAEVYNWFERGNNDDSKRKWNLETLEITKVPYLAPVDPDFLDLVPKRKAETYNLLVATCCTVA